MNHSIHDIGVATHIGRYSDAIETAPNLRWLHTSGTPGISEMGEIPMDISAQARLAWQHILRVLAKARMTTADLVKVTTYLTSSEHIAAYAKVRSEFLGNERPAFMLLVVNELIRPEVLVEIEVIAAA